MSNTHIDEAKAIQARKKYAAELEITVNRYRLETKMAIAEHNKDKYCQNRSGYRMFTSVLDDLEANLN